MDEPTARERARDHLTASAETKRRIAETCLDEILRAAELVAAALRSGGKVMTCGNGGSAADSQHISAEFTNRLSAEFDRPALAAMALTTDTSFLTANANDFGFGYVFERQVQALGREGDILIGISTSGNSENVVRAVRLCRERGIKSGAARRKLTAERDRAIVQAVMLGRSLRDVGRAFGLTAEGVRWIASRGGVK